MSEMQLLDLATWLWPALGLLLAILAAREFRRITWMGGHRTLSRLVAIARPGAAGVTSDSRRRLERVRLLLMLLGATLLLPVAVLNPLRSYVVAKAIPATADRSPPSSDLGDPHLLGSLLSAATLEPDERDGEIVGIRVSNVSDGGVLQAAGVVDGDVIEAVEGVPIDSRERVVHFLRQASELRELRLEVRSVDGKLRPVRLHVEGEDGSRDH